MEQNDNRYEELIRAFHLTWDAFPGTARLIDKENHVLAVNQAAAAAGLLFLFLSFPLLRLF